MTPPQKKPAAGEPAWGSYRATWKGKLAIEAPCPPTMLMFARGPEPGRCAVARASGESDAAAEGLALTYRTAQQRDVVQASKRRAGTNQNRTKPVPPCAEMPAPSERCVSISP